MFTKCYGFLLRRTRSDWSNYSGCCRGLTTKNTSVSLARQASHKGTAGGGGVSAKQDRLGAPSIVSARSESRGPTRYARESVSCVLTRRHAPGMVTPLLARRLAQGARKACPLEDLATGSLVAVAPRDPRPRLAAAACWLAAPAFKSPRGPNYWSAQGARKACPLEDLNLQPSAPKADALSN